MIRVFDRIAAWQQERATLVGNGTTLGFVPTMGALHDGHLSLVRRSRAENARTLVSIFVNPTQFDEAADLAAYPQSPDRDIRALQDERVDFVLVPRAEDLYEDDYRYRVREIAFSKELEGVHRPGHFDGVLTVVLKLLQIASADHAYFGEKDWQQLTLVRDMAAAFFLPTTIVSCPTVRDHDGLALSSRNIRLSPSDRARAPMFYRILALAPTTTDAVKQLTDAGFSVEYVEDRNGRRLGAVRLGGVRLIDNIALGESNDSRA